MTMDMTPEDTKAMDAMANEQPAPEQVETKPEPAPEPKAEEKPVERTYPEAAYRREQNQRREAEKKARDYELKQATLQARLDILEKLAKGEQQPKVPEFDQDPATHLKHNVDTASQKLAEIERRQREEDDRRAQETEEQNFLNAYRAETAQFAQQTKDFVQAYNFVHQHRDKVLERFGITDPAEREYIRQQEERFLVQAARRAGQSAPEKLYEYAKELGYRAAPRDPETGQFKAQEKLETIAKGQEASKTIASGDAPRSGRASLEALASMSEEEFAAATTGKKWTSLWN